MAPMNGVYSRVHSVPLHLSHTGYAALPGSPTSCTSTRRMRCAGARKGGTAWLAWMTPTDVAWT